MRKKILDLIDRPHVQTRCSCVIRAEWTSVIYSVGSQNALRIHLTVFLEWNSKHADKKSPEQRWAPWNTRAPAG